VFTFMILLATSANLVTYFACGLALLSLMARGRLPGVGRTAPWLAAAGVLGSAYSLWAIAGAGREAMAWGLILLAAGLPVYFSVRSRVAGKPRPGPQTVASSREPSSIRQTRALPGLP
jgi:APA family basic amino acid/polyamine antiporter